ncbi:MAG: hypothetical protein ABSG94_03415 [Brevinematales bacterium]|jgi:hypothetical protein
MTIITSDDKALYDKLESALWEYTRDHDYKIRRELNKTKFLSKNKLEFLDNTTIIEKFI